MDLIHVLALSESWWNAPATLRATLEVFARRGAVPGDPRALVLQNPVDRGVPLGPPPSSGTVGARPGGAANLVSCTNPCECYVELLRSMI